MARIKQEYSNKTKRHKTQFDGVYSRQAERVHGKMDVCFDISYKRDGKKAWEKIGWKSQGYSADTARIIRNERIVAMQHGEELPKEKKKAPFFKDVMKKYLTWADTNKANGRTTDNYLYQGKKGNSGHLKHLDDCRLDEIHPFQLEKLKQGILNKGLSLATAKHVLVLVGEVFNKAIAWGMYQGENPIKKVKMPVLQNKRERFLSHHEAKRLLEAVQAKSPQLHLMCLLSLYCGLRAGEILSLRGQDLDFKNKLIHIADPKNKHPRKAYMTSLIKKMLKARTPETPGDLIFRDRKDKQIKSISRTFERVIDELGFNKGITDTRQKVVFHSLRHSFASWLALQGEPIQVIGELLGHRTLTMTQRYAHLTSDQKRRAVTTMVKGFSQMQKGKIILLPKK
jgi:integrase